MAADVPTRKPHQPLELETLEKVRQRAAEKGWAWPDVLEQVREQHSLTADFLPIGSPDQRVLDALRARHARRAARQTQLSQA